MKLFAAEQTYYRTVIVYLIWATAVLRHIQRKSIAFQFRTCLFPYRQLEVLLPRITNNLPESTILQRLPWKWWRPYSIQTLQLTFFWLEFTLNKSFLGTAFLEVLGCTPFWSKNQFYFRGLKYPISFNRQQQLPIFETGITIHKHSPLQFFESFHYLFSSLKQVYKHETEKSIKSLFRGF